MRGAFDGPYVGVRLRALCALAREISGEPMADIPRLNGVIRALEQGKPAFTTFTPAEIDAARPEILAGDGLIALAVAYQAEIDQQQQDRQALSENRRRKNGPPAETFGEQ